jgi:hypothetical protein
VIVVICWIVPQVRDRGTDIALSVDTIVYMSGQLGRTGGGDRLATWVTVREAAKIARVSTSRLRRWYRANEIRSRQSLSSGRRRRSRQTVVALEDVIAHVEGAHPTDGARTTHEPTDPWTIVVDREEWETMGRQLSDIRHRYEALMTAVEETLAAESEPDLLRERLGELRRRVQWLEPGRSTDAPNTSAQPPASTQGDARRSEVEVEWRAEPPTQPSRPGLLRRRRPDPDADPDQPSP